LLQPWLAFGAGPKIANVGDTTVTDVECLVPDDATNWHLLTEALATYPIRALDPDDRAAIPLSVTMGGPAAIEATLTRKVDGVPYQRARTRSRAFAGDTSNEERAEDRGACRGSAKGRRPTSPGSESGDGDIEAFSTRLLIAVCGEASDRRDGDARQTKCCG